MVRLCRCLLILFALIGVEQRLSAASSTREERAFQLAELDFQKGFWERAEIKFGAFAVRYPKSERVPEAILYQAQARFKLEHYGAAIELLSANQASAGPWSEKFLYWQAQACFQNADYAAAADAFARLMRQFPSSPYCLEACVGEATCYARLGEWARIVDLLQQPAGVFQQAAKASRTSELVVRGWLLLGEAQLERQAFEAAGATLEQLAALNFRPELNWRRSYLETRLQLAQDHSEAALQNITNLVALAQAAGDARLQAETTVLEASILEQRHQLEQATAAYQKNLAPRIPADQQGRALAKIADLSIRRGQIAEGVQTLERYLEQQPGAPDLALLTIGELQLKQHPAAGATNHLSSAQATNLLQQARASFDALLLRYTNSPWAGRALLGKGWCLWIDRQYEPAEEAFRLAVGRLPYSVDQAVARFKWGDALFVTNDLAGALTNYDFLVEHYASLPEVQSNLLERALYQTVRAALAVNNLPASTAALRKILDWYPNGFAGDHTLLLVGDGFAPGDPKRARELFAEFEARYPASPLMPEVRLAIARTHEQEGNWAAAVNDYEMWIQTFTNHVRLPSAEFLRARAVTILATSTSTMGQETNALELFSSFVARYPTNELAPQAQWCIADYYYAHGDFYNAWKNYLYVSTNRPSSELTYQAQMMAGWAAMARLNYKDALGYFTNLASKADCPVELRIQAAFAAGDALMSRTDSEASGRRADLEDALGWFNSVATAYPTNNAVPLAYGLIGNCNLQLAVTDPSKLLDASNAYQRVLTFTNVASTTHYQARIGLATVAEKLGQQKTGEEQIRLFNLALNYCLDVLNDNNYPDGEDKRDALSVKEAGLRAGRLAESLNEWQQAINVYTNLQELLPSYRAVWESKILAAQKHLGP